MKKEIANRINALESKCLAKIQALRAELEKPKPTGTRQRAEISYEYFYIDDENNVYSALEGGCEADDRRFNCGNYFLLEEQAQAKADFNQARQNLTDYIAQGDAEDGFVVDFNDRSQNKYLAYFSHDTNTLDVIVPSFTQYSEFQLYGSIRVIKQSLIDCEDDYRTYFNYRDERYD